jgi:maltose 6'-phosphate phosphatase
VNEIQLLYVENTIARKRGVAQQALTFCFYVRNLAYDKQVEVRWTGEDGAWQTVTAAYWAPSGEIGEIWLARTWRQASPAASLPGNVEFVAAYRTGGSEYWCKPAPGSPHANTRGHFTCQADAGLRLGDGLDLLHVGHHPRLQVDQKTLVVDVAIGSTLAPQEVFVEWSDDGWRTKQRTPCFYARDYWDKTQQSVARNPNQYGVQIWTARLRVRDAYRVEYAVGCTTAAGERWDNNRGRNYCTRHADLKVLTLNLHCYQEDNQDYKLSQIARAINELDIDLICLQEVGENWNDGRGDWNSNAAKIICERLDRKYHLHADWAHLGFDRYREGVAILSRFPFRHTDSRYVSATQDAYSIHARRAVFAQAEIPHFGLVNVFSTHLSWWQDGFRQQFDSLAAWANASHSAAIAATLICGDFNVKAGAEGYAHVVQTSDYEDQFLKQSDRKSFDRVFRRHAGISPGNWADRLRDDGRIDYIWAKRGSRLKPTAARRLFLDHDYGRVSDHEGFMVTFEVD